MALLLIRPELDQWLPGKHTGTFRGNNLAFVAATELLGYWENDDLTKAVEYKSKILQKSLQKLADELPELQMQARGRGMIWGLEMPKEGFAKQVSTRAFEKKILVETCGSNSQVVKFLPPLIIEEEVLNIGLNKLSEAVTEVFAENFSYNM